MAKRVNEPSAKRTPEAPCSISDAINDIQQLDVLLKEMKITSNHTAIQKLILSTIQNHWVQSVYWADKQGVTEDDLEEAMEEQEEASQQVDEIRNAGLPEDVLLDNIREIVEKKTQDGTLKESELDIDRIFELLSSAENRVNDARQIQASMGSGPACSGCFIKSGINKCGRCQSIFYCSIECQRSNWPQHKIVCKPVGK